MFLSLCIRCVFCLFVSKLYVFIMQVRKARRIIRRGWERLEYASQMDEEQLSEIELAMGHLDLCRRKVYPVPHCLLIVPLYML